MEANLQAIYSQKNISYINNLKLIDAIDFLEEFMELYEIYEEAIIKKVPLDNNFSKRIYKRYGTVDNLKQCLIMASGLLLCLVKEQIIDYDSREVYVNKETFDTITSALKTKNNKVYLGKIEFDNPLQAMHIIKNHMIHGSYTPTNTHVIICEDGSYGEVDYATLLNYAVRAAIYSKCNSKTYVKSVCLADFYYNVPEYSIVTNKNDFIINQYYLFLTAKGKRLVSANVIKDLELSLNEIFLRNVNKENPPVVENLLCDLKDELEEKYSYIRVEVMQKDLSPNIDKLIQESIKNNPLSYTLLNAIQHATDYTSNNSVYNVFVELLNFIEGALDIPDKRVPTNFKKVELARTIMKFYAYYNYGNDSLLAEKSEINIMDILENKKFDYSIMDLESFVDPNMEIGRSLLIPSDEELAEYLESKKNDYEKIKKTYENFDETKNKQFKEELLERCNELFSNIKITEEHIKSIPSFNKDKYLRNISIINHIRNCLSHGNYDLLINDYYDDNKNILIFNDTVDGKQTYFAKVTVAEFKTLFNYTKEVRSVLENNIPAILDYYDLALLNENQLIDNSKRTEWKNFVKKNKNNIHLIRLAELYINELKGANRLSANEEKNKIYNKFLLNFMVNITGQAIMNTDEIEIEGIILKRDEFYDLLYAILYFCDSLELIESINYSLNTFVNVEDNDNISEINYLKTKEIVKNINERMLKKSVSKLQNKR